MDEQQGPEAPGRQEGRQPCAEAAEAPGKKSAVLGGESPGVNPPQQEACPATRLLCSGLAPGPRPPGFRPCPHPA